MAVLLKRNAKVFVSLVESGWTTSNTVRLNILDDFSYTQSAQLTSAARSTIGPTGDRGLISYAQGLNPASFSFTTYFSLFSGALSDELLWKGLTNKTTVTTIDFSESNTATLPEMFIYMDTGSEVHKLSGAVITGASISMNLEGIPTVTWRGEAKSITSSSSPTTFKDEHGLIPQTIGKLTTITLTRDAVAYNLALTDFSLDIDNGVNWVTRTILGKHYVPTAHYVGERNIGGTMKFYLKTGTNTSLSLFTNVLQDQSIQAIDKFSSAQVSIGGHILINMPNILLENTNLVTDDAISIDVPFVANQTTANAGDEITITVI